MEDFLQTFFTQNSNQKSSLIKSKESYVLRESYFRFLCVFFSQTCGNKFINQKRIYRQLKT